MNPYDHLKHPAYLKPLIAVLQEIHIESVLDTQKFKNLLLRRDLDEKWKILIDHCKEFEKRTSNVVIFMTDFSYSSLYASYAFNYLLPFLSINNSNLKNGGLKVPHNFAQRVLFTALELVLPNKSNEEISEVEAELQILYDNDIKDDDVIIEYKLGNEHSIDLSRFRKKAIQNEPEQKIEDSTFSTDCFVIMPFDPKFDALYEKIIKPAISDPSIGLIPFRQDENHTSEPFFEDLKERIRKAAAVLCIITPDIKKIDRKDVSIYNPNVFLELGMAIMNHSLENSFRVLILSSVEKSRLPADIRHYSIKSYEDKTGYDDENKNTIIKGLAAIMSKSKV